MDSVDVTQLLGIVTKGGPAAIILALFYGLAMLVREVRGGKVGQIRESDLNARLFLLQQQVASLTENMERMENELERALDLVHSMRYQRDQARVRVEFLEQLHATEPRTVWPPEPGSPTAASSTSHPPDFPPPGGTP
ncbi:hypothetical protein [Deinococcus navajonensis]|uniref:Uncharacterized protein n=1 Tax=Deinococcus navajonensis TaxID=309884 RepID=A0ABV8XTD8_9DEIO